VTEADLRAWMDAYTAAFNAQDSQAAANLFTRGGVTATTASFSSR
jgi:hypothetical protein